MTGMLASITSVAEAKITLNEAVDIIDLKNPQKGALGALDKDIVKNIVRVVNGSVPTSATVGDVEPDGPDLQKKIEQMSATGVNIVKVGLFSSRPTEHFLDVINAAGSKNINLVIVVFAEDYLGEESYKSLLNTNIKGIMIDTRDKTGKNLRNILSDSELMEFVTNIKKNGLLTGLAGSLRLDDIEYLLKLESDYLGFRGALCSKNVRVNQLDPFQVKKIRHAIPKQNKFNYAFKEGLQEVLKNGTVA